MKTILITVLSVLIMIAQGCNKTRKYSNRIDDGTWNVGDMTIDGADEQNKPHLEFNNCEIYKETCEGTWHGHHGGHAHFAWQFRNNGQEFELSNQTDEIHNTNDIDAVEQCISYTGVYDVVNSKKNELVLTSNKTVGHPGKTVVIKLKK